MTLNRRNTDNDSSSQEEKTYNVGRSTSREIAPHDGEHPHDSNHPHGLGNEEEDLDVLTQIPSQLENKLPEPPNGGLIAWLQVLAALFANFNSWGIVNAFGDFQQYYQNNLLSDRTPFQISWIVSLSGSLTFFATHLFGVFIDMGYIKYMAFFGMLLQFAALMLLSWSKTYAEIILTQGLFVGCVSALLFLISISAVAPYFSTKRPLAIGIGASGSSWGGTIYSIMARNLTDKVGFGWSTRIIAFTQLATTATVFLCVKRILPPTRRKSVLAVECFTEPATMLYSIGNIFGFLALYTSYVYFQSYAIEQDSAQGKPENVAYSYLTAIVNAGSVLGRIIPSLIATKVGPFNVLLVSDICSIILLFCWIPAKNEGGIIAVTVIFGFVSGPIMALPGSIVAALTKDFNRLGIRLSFAFTFMSFGIVLGPPIAGIIERKYGWFWLKIYSALGYICAFVCHTSARVLLGGFNPKIKV